MAETVHLGATEAQRGLAKGFTVGRMLSTWGIKLTFVKNYMA